MTSYSATDFFRTAARAPDGPVEPRFEHEEVDTGADKRPTKVHLHAVHPETGDRMGTLTYYVPRRKADKIFVDHLGANDAYRRQGVGSALMDEMQRRHPGIPIDHGERTPTGKAWWKGYTDGKRVRKGRTIAARSDAFRTASIAMPDGIICVYPHEPAIRTAAASGWEGHDPAFDFGQRDDGGRLSWTQARQYGAEDYTRRDLPEHRIGSVEEAQTIANKITDKADIPRVEVSHDPRYNYSFAQVHAEHPGYGRIVLGRGGMNHTALLHEVAHHIDRHKGTQDPDEVHGDSFRQHFDDLLPRHHPNSYVAQHAFRHAFYWTDQKMRDGVPARGNEPNPEMNEKERAAPPVEKPHALWESNPEHVEKARNAMKWRSEPHGYLKYHHQYPELDYEDEGDYERADAHMADEDLSKGLSPHLVPPHMLEAWVKHHPNPKAMEEPEWDEDGNDLPLGKKAGANGDLPEKFRRSPFRASLRHAASVDDGDDIPSTLLNPHGHHIRVRTGGYDNVEMVPRSELLPYAHQNTDPERAKEVGTHTATSGEMEPLILHYHPDSGEAYLGEGNHRLRAAGPLKMDYLPVRVHRASYGLPGPGTKVPHDHPAHAAGTHVPYNIKPSDLGLTTVHKPTMSEGDKRHELAMYNLTRSRKSAGVSFGPGGEKPPFGEDSYEQDSGYYKGLWNRWHPMLQPTMHRHLSLQLPADHPAHDTTLPTEQRARAIVDHVSQGDGGTGRLGVHWTDDPNYDHFDDAAHGTARRTNGATHAIIHAATPPRDHIEDNEHVLTDRAVYDWDTDEREVPLKRNAPVHITGVSWASPDGRKHHTFDQPIQRTAADDTPVPHNTDPYVHTHDWLPDSHFFAPSKHDLDPRLFDGDHMHPAVRRYLLGLLNAFWAPRYGDSWQSWARVYLAGGAASHFWGDNNDLDVLIGVDFDALNQHSDAFTGEPWGAVADRLTAELKDGLNDDHRMLPLPDGGESGPWESTFFILKPGPGEDQADITRIHPYAAYDLTNDTWAVHPVATGDDFNAHSLPEAQWDITDAVRKLVDAIAELPPGVREREAAALYDYLHTDRSAAFGPEGTGLYDPANAGWKALVAAPGQPLQRLVDWKHAHDKAREAAA